VYLFRIILYIVMRARRILLQYTFSDVSNKSYLYSVVYIFYCYKNLFSWNKTLSVKVKWGKVDFFVNFTWMGYYWKGANFCLEVLSNVNLKREVFCMRKICNAFNTLYLYTNIIFGLKTIFSAKFATLQINFDKHLYNYFNYELIIYI